MIFRCHVTCDQRTYLPPLVRGDEKVGLYGRPQNDSFSCHMQLKSVRLALLPSLHAEPLLSVLLVQRIYSHVPNACNILVLCKFLHIQPIDLN